MAIQSEYVVFSHCSTFWLLLYPFDLFFYLCCFDMFLSICFCPILVLGVCDISSVEEANDMLKCEVEVMAKEIEQQMEVLEETKIKFILERRDLLAKNEKLKNDLESQKKIIWETRHKVGGARI